MATDDCTLALHSHVFIMVWWRQPDAQIHNLGYYNPWWRIWKQKHLFKMRKEYNDILELKLPCRR
jgi:hypothetical protein